MVTKRGYKIQKCQLSEIAHFNEMESNNTSQISEGKIPIHWYKCVDAETEHLLGCIGILMRGKTAHGRGLFVHPDYRGNGLGSYLVKEQERLALEFGADKFTVKTAEHRIFVRLNYHWDGKEYKTFNGRGYYKLRQELWDGTH